MECVDKEGVKLGKLGRRGVEPYGFSQRMEHKKQHISFIEHFLSKKWL